MLFNNSNIAMVINFGALIDLYTKLSSTEF